MSLEYSMTRRVHQDTPFEELDSDLQKERRGNAKRIENAITKQRGKPVTGGLKRAPTFHTRTSSNSPRTNKTPNNKPDVSFPVVLRPQDKINPNLPKIKMKGKISNMNPLRPKIVR